MLKSPLFGLTEEQLFALAWERKGTLRAALRAKASDLDFAARHDAARALRRMGAASSPFAFYAACSAPTQGRARFWRGSAHEATDALDEFLNLALDYERRETPIAAGLRRLAAHRRRPR